MIRFRSPLGAIALSRRSASILEASTSRRSGSRCSDHRVCWQLVVSPTGRKLWRYDYARAYRSILAEAGHLAQTFCLVATRLGLAPFCSMALADSTIEKDLGIDGVSESVVYCAGVGTRPEGVAWAPWPDSDRVPARAAPTWQRRQSLRTARSRFRN